MLKLVVPTIKQKKEAIEFIKEFRKYNSNLNGTGGLESYTDNYDNWLNIVSDYARGLNLKSGYVPASTFFVIRQEDNRIVGMINIRHELSEYLLQQGGHIGYGIRPTERKKGYATQTLYLGLEKCEELGIDKVLLTCDKDNLGSAKTIQNNYGILENEFYDEREDETFQRYWIDVEYALGNKKIK